MKKHVAHNVAKEHYEVVGKHLLQALADVLGDKATDEVMNAWKEAYWFLANLLIDAETKLAKERANQEG